MHSCISGAFFSRAFFSISVAASLSGCKVGDTTYTPTILSTSAGTNPSPNQSAYKIVNNPSAQCKGVTVQRVEREMFQGMIPVYAMYVRNDSGKRIEVTFDIKYSEIGRSTGRLAEESWWEQFGPTVMRPAEGPLQFIVKRLDQRRSPLTLVEVNVVRCAT